MARLKATSFFECNGEIFYVLPLQKNQKKANFPIVCLNTGLGCTWTKFKNKPMKKLKIDIEKLSEGIPFLPRATFSCLKKGDLFLFSAKREEHLCLKLPVNIINGKNEDDSSLVFEVWGSIFFALNLNTGKLIFGLPCFFEHLQDLQGWPVCHVVGETKTVLGIQ